MLDLKLRGKYEKIRKIVEKELSCSAHDFDHVSRVYNTAIKIAESEKGVDMDVLKSAVLLHDIARVKEDTDLTGNTCHAEESAKMSGKILKNLNYPKNKIDKIQKCILSHRYKTDQKPESIEAKILFDADKLDSLGAIVVVRASMWMCKNGCRVFSDNMSLEEYVKKNLVGGKSGHADECS